MLGLRQIGCVGLTVGAVLVGPATSAGAHVHGITPLRCTPAVQNTDTTGANRTDETPASATQGGPIQLGVIPITMGGNVPLFGGGFDAAVCS